MSYLVFAYDQIWSRSFSAKTIEQVVAIVSDCLDAGFSIDRILNSEGALLRYEDLDRAGLSLLAEQMGWMPSSERQQGDR